MITPDRATVVVCDGVCLFFENSTVCRMLVPCLFWPRVPGWMLCLVGYGVSLSGFWCFASDQSGAPCFWCVGVLFSVGHSTESLILAQDERWRRA